jgi:hypothetical protein
MKTYLVQRANFKERENKTGIDSILRFDYMGASEYEWGALPDSLKRIRKEIDTYTYMDIPIEDKVITVFCKETQKSDMKTFLREIADDKMRMKCMSKFDIYIKSKVGDKPNSWNEFDFWWDLENDLMWWKKSNEFEGSFKEKINEKKV